MTFETARRRRERWYDAHSFTSEGLRYRPPRVADAEAVLALYDDEVRHQQGWPDDVYSERLLRQRWRRPLLDRCAPELLVSTAAGAIVGDYSFAPGPEAGTVSMGWSFGPHGRGVGYGTESLAAMLHYAHRHVGIARIHLGTRATNERAVRQIERSGASLRTVSPYELPNGEITTGRWYVHEDAQVTLHDQLHGALTWASPCRR